MRPGDKNMQATAQKKNATEPNNLTRYYVNEMDTRWPSISISESSYKITILAFKNMQHIPCCEDAYKNINNIRKYMKRYFQYKEPSMTLMTCLGGAVICQNCMRKLKWGDRYMCALYKRPSKYPITRLKEILLLPSTNYSKN